jgi:predicted ABC-type ATPase
MSKTIEIFAGPNGSGKTTFAKSILTGRKDFLSFNSDAIASGLKHGKKDAIQFEAGRYMLQSIEKAFKKNESFSFETTFSGKLWKTHLESAKKNGYKIIIYFVFVNNIELSIKRIKQRVKAGGHDVENKIVRRRFKRTFENMIKLYSQLADEWYLVNNSGKDPVIIAYSEYKNINILDQKTFKKLFQ